ncbi:MAG: hypothetical protein CVU11_13765 [Bacteroidetes bacterium HGW-Bacteroidetes-6]|jgi:hypothetical protein|nr:MAG: hypothetical protein CVU11_13765 [Bacteroidetes bacterium HGW-Bacteroidetes-6]
MKKPLLSLFVLLIGLGIGFDLSAQSTYIMPIEITEQTGLTQTDFQIHLTVNTQALVSQNKMNASGSDIRFFEDSCMSTALNHWVEMAMNTDTTEIWVMIPSLPASSATTIYMAYGDTSATDVSSFSTTFPNAVVSGGTNVTLSGSPNVDWLQIDSGDTLFVTAGSVLDINAREIRIDGVVFGKGAGNAGGVVSEIGYGFGGGGTSTNSGSGGGSYGGVGGTGGFDTGDTPGTGGPIYGTDTGMDIDMGSGGGASASCFGGNGGAGILFTADYLTINGAINVSGTDAFQPGGGQGGGGGSGGGFLGAGFEVIFTGAISSDGGNGSVGTSTANDDGGGGAGGRIKLFSDQTLINTGTVSVIGGLGGPNGSVSPGLPGATGVFHVGSATYEIPLVLFGIEDTIQLSSPNIVATGTNCAGDTITLSAENTFASYLWNTGDTTNSIAVVSGGEYTLATTIIYCGFIGYDTIAVSYNALPIVDLGAALTLCLDSSTTLDAGGGLTNYLWSTGDTTQTVLLDGSILGVGVFPYTVTVTDGNGCQNSSSVNVSVVDCPNGLDESSVATVFDVYPNPATNNLVVNAIVQDASITTVSILDITGRLLYASTFNSSEILTTIDVSMLQSGTYFVEISNSKGTIAKMIVKN